MTFKRPIASVRTVIPRRGDLASSPEIQTYMASVYEYLSSKRVTTVSIGSGGGGTGYVVGDTFEVSGGTGDPAVLEVVSESGGVITAIKVADGEGKGTVQGGEYTVDPDLDENQPTLILTGSGNGDAFFDLTLSTPNWSTSLPVNDPDEVVLSVNRTPSSGGTGYAVGDTLTLIGGTSTFFAAQVQVTEEAGGSVTAVKLTLRGIYTAAPASPATTTTNGDGTGATIGLTSGELPGSFSFTATPTVKPARLPERFQINLRNYQLTSQGVVTVSVGSTGGTNYALGDRVQLSGGSGTAAVFIITSESAGGITGIAVDISGRGSYSTVPPTQTDNPAVTLTGSGAGALINATLSYAAVPHQTAGFIGINPDGDSDPIQNSAAPSRPNFSGSGGTGTRAFGPNDTFHTGFSLGNQFLLLDFDDALMVFLPYTDQSIGTPRGWHAGLIIEPRWAGDADGHGGSSDLRIDGLGVLGNNFHGTNNSGTSVWVGGAGTSRRSAIRYNTGNILGSGYTGGWVMGAVTQLIPGSSVTGVEYKFGEDRISRIAPLMSFMPTQISAVGEFKYIKATTANHHYVKEQAGGEDYLMHLVSGSGALPMCVHIPNNLAPRTDGTYLP